MTTDIDAFIGTDPSALLDALPRYQRSRVEQLLSQSGGDELAAAELWLSALPENTHPFGVEVGRTIFLDKVVAEVKKFICDNDEYADEKQEFAKYKECATLTLVSAISAVLSQALGVVAVYIAPVVVLVLMTVAKIGRNAWCLAQKELK